MRTQIWVRVCEDAAAFDVQAAFQGGRQLPKTRLSTTAVADLIAGVKDEQPPADIYFYTAEGNTLPENPPAIMSALKALGVPPLSSARACGKCGNTREVGGRPCPACSAEVKA